MNAVRTISDLFPRRRLAAALAAAALLALAGCAYTIGERDLFHPRRFPTIGDAVALKNVEIRAADGTILRGWHFSIAGSTRSVLYFYGNGESVLAVAPVLAGLAERLRADVLAVDYRGYGFSEGQPSLEGIAADAPLLYDFLAAQGRPVIVFGRSLGTVFALKTALARPAAGLILQAPPTSIQDVLKAWQRELPWYLRPFLRLRPDKRLRALGPQPGDEIARLSAPLLVIHGTADRPIPVALGRRMYTQAGSALKRLCLVEGGDHNDIDVLRGPAALCLGQFIDQVAP